MKQLGKLTLKATYNFLQFIFAGKFFSLFFFKELIDSTELYRKTNQFAKKSGILNFDRTRRSFFLNKNKDKVFFILGGGSSINLITKEKWDFIAKNTSLGINYWFVHDFEPDFLMIEGFRKKYVNSALYNWTVCELTGYIKKSRSVLLLKDAYHSYFPWIDIAKICPEKTFLISYFDVPGASNSERDMSIKMTRAVGGHKVIPIFSRASVTLAMSIGLLLGYKKIVLCGIDLNDTKYFWESPDFNKSSNKTMPPETGQKSSGTHSTVDQAVNEITVDRSILMMTDQFFKPLGVEVYVASETSLLFPKLPKFEGWGSINTEGSEG
jgi:hypothetical protein